jgi:putative phage-type endonuclease
MIKEIPYKNREEWLKLRRELGVGGSEAGAIIGLNPYQSAYSLWAEKTGRIEGFEGNLTTEVGTYLEEFVAKLFEKETGKKVRRKNKMIVNDRYPWAFANVDRLVCGENAVLEIKTTNSFPNMRKFAKGEYPEQWYCQMTHYLGVGEYDKAYLAVLVNCRELKVFELERDEDEIESLMSTEKDFWDLVKTDTAPDADGLEATTKALSKVFPESDGSSVNLMGYESDMDSYMALSKQIGELTKLKDAVGNRIKAFMGNAAKGESSCYKVSYSSSERRSFDEGKFASVHPNIALDDFYKVTSSRTLRITKKPEA